MMLMTQRRQNLTFETRPASHFPEIPEFPKIGIFPIFPKFPKFQKLENSKISRNFLLRRAKFQTREDFSGQKSRLPRPAVKNTPKCPPFVNFWRACAPPVVIGPMKFLPSLLCTKIGPKLHSVSAKNPICSKNLAYIACGVFKKKSIFETDLKKTQHRDRMTPG